MAAVIITSAPYHGTMLGTMTCGYNPRVHPGAAYGEWRVVSSQISRTCELWSSEPWWCSHNMGWWKMIWTLVWPQLSKEMVVWLYNLKFVMQVVYTNYLGYTDRILPEPPIHPWIQVDPVHQVQCMTSIPTVGCHYCIRNKWVIRRSRWTHIFGIFVFVM